MKYYRIWRSAWVLPLLLGTTLPQVALATTETSTTVSTTAQTTTSELPSSSVSSLAVEPSSSTEPSLSTTVPSTSSTIISTEPSTTMSTSGVSTTTTTSSDGTTPSETKPGLSEEEAAPTRILGSIARGDDYPYRNLPLSPIYIDPWRFYHRQCTSFVAWRLQEVNGFRIPFYGNAWEWKAKALNLGYKVDKQPALGSVAYWSGNHVSWVSGIQGNYVEIEEYNYGFTGKYNKRIIPISQVEAFIHFKDVSVAKPIVPQSISLSKTAHTMTVGSSYLVTATVTPTNATNKAVTWRSRNPKVATVADGVITARASGTTEIVATTVSGAKVAKMKVTVQKQSNSPISIYRLYNPSIRRHLYTKDVAEVSALKERGWNFENESFRTPLKGKPVYRLYHSTTREHVYTIDVKERDTMVKNGWNYEGVAFQSSGKKPLYRLYHPGLKVHLYTGDASEWKYLSQRGWNDEGIAFYTL